MFRTYLAERGVPMKRVNMGSISLTCVASLLFGLILFAATQGKASVQKDSDVGVEFKLQASEKEVGLPIYPGAKPHHDDKGDSSSANMGLWGNSFGFKLVVLKLESPDAPAKISAFYQKALTKYGKVLDCSNGTKKTDDSSKKQSSNALTCDDTPETGAMLFKSGTKGKQHIVGIEAKAPGSVFQLVFLDTRGIDTDEKPQ
jgi:hypothetical protein